nr:MAG TPA: hypothetical protein [Caudoviricetes sp.]
MFALVQMLKKHCLCFQEQTKRQLKELSESIILSNLTVRMMKTMANIIERTGSDVTFSKEVCEKIVSLEKQAKEIKKQQDSMKKDILDAMQKYGVLKIDNEFLKIAFIPEHDTEKFNTKTFKEENPDVYDLYAKISKVKPSIRITVK